MPNHVKKKVKHRDIQPWNVAIADAKAKLDRIRKTAVGLEKAIATFEKLRDAGHQWPGAVQNQSGMYSS